MGLRPRPDQIIRDEKHQQTKIHFQVLLHDGRAFLEEEGLAGIRREDSVGGVPSLFAGQHMDEVVPVRPQRGFLIGNATGEFGEKKIANLEPVDARIRTNCFD